MEMLEGKEEEVEKAKGEDKEERHKDKRNEENQKKEHMEKKRVEEEEICRAVRKMKKGKATGIDGIQMEAFIYGGREIRKRVIELITKIWEERRISEEWRLSIVVPIYKKGDYNRRENYRGISLPCTLYKI